MGRHNFRNLIAAFAVAGALVTASVVTTDVALASVGWKNPGNCCQTCGEVIGVCTCTTMQPVCETTMRRQDCITWQEVPQTCYRDEEYVVTIPTIDYDTVTVAEGCYKMVWVPNPVEKIIPKTVYKKDIRTRKVPFTVTQKVPRVSSQWVPEQNVRYIPHTTTQYFRQPFSAPCPPVANFMTPGFDCGGGFGTAMGGNFGGYGGFGGGYAPPTAPTFAPQGGCPTGQCGMNYGMDAGAVYADPGYQPTPAPGPVPAPTPDGFEDPAAWSNVPSRAAMAPRMFPHVAAQQARPMPRHNAQYAAQHAARLAAHQRAQQGQAMQQAARQRAAIQQAAFQQPQQHQMPLRSAYQQAFGHGEFGAAQQSAIQQVGYSH